MARLVLSSLPTIMSTDTEPATQVVETALTPDTDEEPQNSLTQKFTDKEWAALKEFRVRATPLIHSPVPYSLTARLLSQPLLPDILEKAYDGKEGSRTTPIVIWGVELDPNGKKDARASVVLMKWLRAR